MLHLKVIDRQRELIGELTPEGLLSYLESPQESQREEHAIESPQKSLMSITSMTLARPAVRKEPPHFEFSSEKASLNHNEEVLI